MEVQIRFPLITPILVNDSWPLAGHGGTLHFERKGDEIVALTMRYRNRPIEDAPTIGTSEVDGRFEIGFHDDLERLARLSVVRFLDYANLFYDVAIDKSAVEVTYAPESDGEKERIRVGGFSSKRAPVQTRHQFSVLAQAFYASEGADDPSFASQLVRMAREAFGNEQFVDSFRYAFLLVEALYGDGKFRNAELTRALETSPTFSAITQETLTEFRSSLTIADADVRELVNQYPTTHDIIEHMVDRRGYYFHGNKKRSDPWHPARQEDAKTIAHFSSYLTLKIGQTFAEPMFLPWLGDRHIQNAEQQGVILNVLVEISYVDEHDLPQTRRLEIRLPGSAVHNQLALKIHKDVLTKLHGGEMTDRIVRSIRAVDRDTGTQIFNAEYQPVIRSGPGST